MSLKSIADGLSELRHNRYVSIPDAVIRMVRNRRLPYRMCDIGAAKGMRGSGTVFVLGSGPSLNRIKGNIVEKVRAHDSFGINFSVLFDAITPTFQQMSYESEGIARGMICQALASQKARLTDSVFMLNTKMLWRMGHPRVTPEFFPDNPCCCIYSLRPPIAFQTERPFLDSDFESSLVYRGTLTVVLDLVVRLGYTRIVLIGVDPDTSDHFFDSYECMKEYVAFQNSRPIGNRQKKIESMYPKGRKIHPINVYLYALREYMERRHGIELLTAFSDNMLYPGLPAYFTTQDESNGGIEK